MHVTWIRCENNNWCGLLDVNLHHEHFNDMNGVYIIWHGGQYPATVDVGQGIIKERIAFHRQDNAVLAYRQFGLYVTWAEVESACRNGVERYLADVLSPKIGRRYPDVPPIEVNLPW